MPPPATCPPTHLELTPGDAGADPIPHAEATALEEAPDPNGRTPPDTAVNANVTPIPHAEENLLDTVLGITADTIEDARR